MITSLDDSERAMIKYHEKQTHFIDNKDIDVNSMIIAIWVAQLINKWLILQVSEVPSSYLQAWLQSSTNLEIHQEQNKAFPFCANIDRQTGIESLRDPPTICELG